MALVQELPRDAMYDRLNRNSRFGMFCSLHVRTLISTWDAMSGVSSALSTNDRRDILSGFNYHVPEMWWAASLKLVAFLHGTKCNVGASLVAD